MSVSFLPTVRTESVTQLEPAQLHQWGIRLLMLDFDNTIVPYTTSVPTQQMRDWLQMMGRSDIHICVVSNSRNSRVKDFCQEYGIDCITHANKPFSNGIRQCLAKYGISPQEAALAGDQIFTDTLGGNCAGVRTVLVRAIHNHTIWLKLRNVMELPFILLAKNRRLNHE